jgi:chaperonin cofactor prefoldin
MKLKHDAASAKLDELKYKENIFDFEQMRAKLDEETTALNISVQSLDDQCVVVTNEIDLVKGQLSEKYVDQNAIRLKIYRGLGFEWINEHGENDEARLRVISSRKDDVATLLQENETNFEFCQKLWTLIQ